MRTRKDSGDELSLPRVVLRSVTTRAGIVVMQTENPVEEQDAAQVGQSAIDGPPEPLPPASRWSR